MGFSGAELAVEWRREDKMLFSPTNEQLTPPKVGNIVLPIVPWSVAVHSKYYLLYGIVHPSRVPVA